MKYLLIRISLITVILLICVGCAPTSIPNKPSLEYSADIVVAYAQDYGNGIYYIPVISRGIFNHTSPRTDFGERLSTFLKVKHCKIISIVPDVHGENSVNAIAGYWVIIEEKAQ
jgi:hypothetical protein